MIDYREARGVSALLDVACQGPTPAQIDAAPGELLAYCRTPRLVEQLYPWGARRRLRPRMVRAIVAALLDGGQLATDATGRPADWQWVWSPAHATGPGERPAQEALDALTPPRPAADDEPEPVEESDDEPEPEPEDDEDERLSRNHRARAVRALSLRETGNLRAVKRAGEAYPEQPGVDYQRPRTRGECENGPRPCPFVSCRYHLYLDVLEDTGSLKINFPDLDPAEMALSCSLDVAAEGGATLIRVGDLLNITRERIRQIEATALANLPRRPLLAHTDQGALIGRPVRRLPLLPSPEPPARPEAPPTPPAPPPPEESPMTTTPAPIAPAAVPLSLVPTPEPELELEPLAPDALTAELVAWPPQLFDWLADQRRQQVNARLDIEESESLIERCRHQIVLLEQTIEARRALRLEISQRIRDTLAKVLATPAGAKVELPPMVAPSTTPVSVEPVVTRKIEAPAPGLVVEAPPPPPPLASTRATWRYSPESIHGRVAALLDELSEDAEPLTGPEIAEQLDVLHKSVGVALSELTRLGRIERVGRGQYRGKGKRSAA